MAYPYRDVGNTGILILMLVAGQAAAGEGGVDSYGDPLPPHAVARFGTVRLRHAYAVNSVALSPDGSVVASASEEGAVYLWQAATGKKILTLKETGERSNYVAFSLDGKMLAVGGDVPLALRDAVSGQIIRTLSQDVYGFCAAFSPDGKSLASAGRGVRLWDVSSGKQLRRLPCEEDMAIRCLAFSPDGKKIVAGGYDGPDNFVFLWNAITGELLFKSKKYNWPVRSVAFSPDGKSIAWVCQDGKIYLREVESAKPPRLFLREKEGGLCLHFSADGTLLVCATFHGSIKFWSTSTSRLVLNLKDRGNINSIAFSPDGKVLVSGNSSYDVRIWNTTTGRQRLHFEGHQEAVTTVVFSPDGKHLAAADGDGAVKLWDVRTGKVVREFLSHAGAVTSLAFSSDGKALISGGQDSLVRVWDVNSGRAVRALKGHTECIHCVAFSPDGRTLASLGAAEKTIRLWDFASGAERHVILTGSSSPLVIAFSPDSKKLVGGVENEVRLWSVTTGKELRRYDGHTFSVHGIAFSSTGQQIASGSWDNTIRLWDSRNGEQLTGCYEAGSMFIHSVAFSPDDSLLAVSCGQSVLLLETLTCKPIRHLTGHQGYVNAAAVSPDGRTIASASGDQTILLWDISSESFRSRENRVKPSEQVVEQWWLDLGHPDPARAYHALASLVAIPDQTIPLLHRHLHPATVPGSRLAASLIAEFDNDDFEVREQAEKKVEKLGDVMIPFLRKALLAQPSAEARRRIEALLSRLGKGNSPESLRDLRALRVLEQINSPRTRETLQRLASGTPDAVLTREAKAALTRLTRLRVPVR